MEARANNAPGQRDKNGENTRVEQRFHFGRDYSRGGDNRDSGDDSGANDELSSQYAD